MTFDRRIWKTGVLAVVATLIFAVFVFRVEEFTRGLNSEFIVYGQSGSGGGTSGGGTTSGCTTTNASGTSSSTCVTKIIPQISIGSFDGNLQSLSTIIQIVNTGTAAATISGNFYNEPGTAATLAMTYSNGGGAATSFTGSFSNLSLAVNGVLVINGTTTQPTYTPLWGKIVSTASITISSVFEVRNVATGEVLTRVGVPASDDNMKKFAIPRIVNGNAAGLLATIDTGFAIVNTGTAAGILTATLRKADGTTVATKTGWSFNAGEKKVGFLHDLFPLTTETPGRSYQFVVLEQTSPATTGQFGAMALGIEGVSLTSFPVDKLQ